MPSIMELPPRKLGVERIERIERKYTASISSTLIRIMRNTFNDCYDEAFEAGMEFWGFSTREAFCELKSSFVMYVTFADLTVGG